MVGKETMGSLILNERRSAMITEIPEDPKEWGRWFFKELKGRYLEDMTLINAAYELGGEQARRKVYQMFEDGKTDAEVKVYVRSIA